MKERLLIFFFLIVSLSSGYGQVSILLGTQYANVRDDGLLPEKTGIPGMHMGLEFEISAPESKISFIMDALFSLKGYKQDLDQVQEYRFVYASVPIMLKYTPIEHLAISAGFEPSALVLMAREDSADNYEGFDLGLIFGISTLNKKKVSPYVRGYFGTLPVLDYFFFDQLGNFDQELKLRHINLMVGLKFSLI